MNYKYILGTLVLLGALTACGVAETPPDALSSPSAHPASPKPDSVILAVSVVTPTFGGNARAFSYPAEITVASPATWASQLEAVGAVGFIAIVPKGWEGQALVAADGARDVALYPAGGSATHGPRLVIQTASSSEGTAWQDAAPFFSYVRSHISAAGYGAYAGPTIGGTLAAPDLSFYGLTTPNGYHANGIAYAPFISNDQSGVLYRGAEVVLPPGEHTLATLILNQLLPQLQ